MYILSYPYIAAGKQMNNWHWKYKSKVGGSSISAKKEWTWELYLWALLSNATVCEIQCVCVYRHTWIHLQIEVRRHKAEVDKKRIEEEKIQV